MVVMLVRDPAPFAHSKRPRAPQPSRPNARGGSRHAHAPSAAPKPRPKHPSPAFQKPNALVTQKASAAPPAPPKTPENRAEQPQEPVATPNAQASARQPGARAVPDRVRAILMRAIRYPWIARKNGWQGRCEFAIQVRNERIAHLAMLRSTGFRVLDRAAEKGILSVARIPLADGRYRLPVEFRLR